MKKQIRRSRDEIYKNTMVSIPVEVLVESKKIAKQHFPDPFYSFSHYITSALIRQNRRFR